MTGHPWPDFEEVRLDLLARIEHLAGELDVAETRFRDVVLHSPDGVVLLDRGGQVFFANPSAMRLLGRPLNELLGDRIAAPAPGGTSILEVMPSDGRRVLVELRCNRMSWENEEVTVVTMRDLPPSRSPE